MGNFGEHGNLGLSSEVSEMYVGDLRVAEHMDLFLDQAGELVALAQRGEARATIVETVRSTTAALEEANVELVEFTYRISHDLRSPIVSARGLVQVAED